MTSDLDIDLYLMHSNSATQTYAHVIPFPRESFIRDAFEICVAGY